MLKNKKYKGFAVPGIIAVLIVGLFVVVTFALFTSWVAEGGENADPKNAGEILNDPKNVAACQLKCTIAGVGDIEDCKETVEGDDRTCGEIIVAAGDLETDPSRSSGSGTSGRAYVLEGSFQPCSRMTVKFRKGYDTITDFGIKIVTSAAAPLTLRDSGGSDILPAIDDGYYRLCGTCTDTDSDGQAEITFSLPCEKKAELQQFMPGDYKIAFISSQITGGDLYTIDKKWSCIDDATFPGGIVFNQKKGTPGKTVVKFQRGDILNENRQESIKARLKLLSPAQCEDPVTGAAVSCTIGPESPLGLKYDSSERQYYFTMPGISGSTALLTGLEFQILVETESGDVHVCTAKEPASLECESPEQYICYEDGGKEYILSSPAETGKFTRDGVCFYSKKTEFVKGCVDIASGAITGDKETGCELPAKIYRKDSDTIIGSTGKCIYPDLEIAAVYSCRTESDCSENTYFTSADTARFIAVKLKNTGEVPVELHSGNIDVKINGNAETVVTLITGEIAEETVIGPGAELEIKGITAEGLNGNIIRKIANTVTIELDNIDTAKYPVVDVLGRESNNVKTAIINVYPQCCGTCTTCREDICSDISGGCGDICKWSYDEISGYGCVKK